MKRGTCWYTIDDAQIVQPSAELIHRSRSLTHSIKVSLVSPISSLAFEGSSLIRDRGKLADRLTDSIGTDPVSEDETANSPIPEPENEHDVAHNHDGELDELQGCEVLLPPQVFLNFGAARGQEVVAVHDDVDHGVEAELEAREREPSVRDVKVNGECHTHVMEHMQERNLSESALVNSVSLDKAWTRIPKSRSGMRNTWEDLLDSIESLLFANPCSWNFREL